MKTLLLGLLICSTTIRPIATFRGWLVFIPGDDVYLVPGNETPTYHNFFVDSRRMAYRISELKQVYNYYNITKKFEVYDSTFGIHYQMHVCPIEFSYDTVREHIYTPDTTNLVILYKNKRLALKSVNYFDYGSLQLTSFNKKDSIAHIANKVFSNSVY